MDYLHIVIIGTLFALAVWGGTAAIGKLAYRQFASFQERREQQSRAAIRRSLQKEKHARISAIVKRMYESNDYLLNLVMYRRSLPRFKHNKSSKHSPTKYIDDHMLDLIQDQIRRSMTTAEHTLYHDVYKRIVD
jgi:hypothetical protein